MHMRTPTQGMLAYISICEWRLSHAIIDEYYCETRGLVRASLAKVAGGSGLVKRDATAVSRGGGPVVSGCDGFLNIARLPVEHYSSHLCGDDGAGTRYCVRAAWHPGGRRHHLTLRLFERSKIVPDRAKAEQSVATFTNSNGKNRRGLYSAARIPYPPRA